MTRTMMFQGVGANAGKTVFTRSFSRWLSNQGYRVAPFKAVTVGKTFEQRDDLTLDFRMWILAAAARAHATSDNAPVQVLTEKGKPSTLFLHQQELGTVQLYAQDSPLLHELTADQWDRLKQSIQDSYRQLVNAHDVVVIEGAGCPIDLGPYDLANTYVAEITGAPIVLVASVSAGGALPALQGTYLNMPESVKQQVIGFMLNDANSGQTWLNQQAEALAERLGIPYLGAFPHCTIYDNIPPGQHSSLEDDEAEYEYLSEQFANNLRVDVLMEHLNLLTTERS